MDNIEKQVAQQKRLALKHLLPDTCRVIPKSGTNRIVSGVGVRTTDPPVPRQYLGSQFIPCRIDLSRAFRPGTLPAQVTAVDEHVAEFPADFFFEETDIVWFGSSRFIIRKTNTEGDWTITREATLGQLGVNQDVV